MPQQADTERAVRADVLPRYLMAALGARLADEGARVSLVLLGLSNAGSAAIGGVLVAALLIPHVVAAPLVGAVLDRARRPAWVITPALLIFAASLWSVALLLGHAPLWLVLVVLVLGGCCGPAITGGLTSQLPGLAGRARAPRAFGFDSLFYNVASMAGPAVAGITAAAANPVVAQSALAASAAFGAAGVATLPFVARTHPATEEAPPGLLSGAQEILRKPALRVITLCSTLGQIGPGALAVVAALLATSLHTPASSGLLLTAVAAGSFIGSLLWTWRPLAPDQSPLVTTVSMIGVGVPIALAAASPSIEVTAALFTLSGIFIGPFGSALFTARSQLADEANRSQVFTIGAGLKVTASAVGAGLIGLVTGLPIWALLLLVASSPLLAGILGTVLLLLHRQPVQDRQLSPAK